MWEDRRSRRFLQRGTDVVMARKIASHVAWQIVEGEAILVDLSSGTSIGLNPAGTLIWSVLERLDERAIVQQTAEHFGISHEVAQRDVQEFLIDMERRRLIEAGA
jgi:hypothetical protein